MQKGLVIAFLFFSVIISVSFTNNSTGDKDLRGIYGRPTSEWPAPFVDPGVSWKELALLPESPLEQKKDSLRHLIELGKVLFFDTRLSSSGKIACVSCHQPELSWTDGKDRSAGHEGATNKRNSPTILNVWFYDRLFWDGRSSGLEDQAFAPINSESEMHGDMRELPFKLRRIKGYPVLFDSAFGDPMIDPDRIAGALATFQRTLISQRSRFDEFLAGEKNALEKNELRGLHLFRTKARCMNCHHGALFSDNLFHNNGFSAIDKGRYNITHREEDLGKLKTPSLRDVTYTGPWMHAGQISDLEELIKKYNNADFPAIPPADGLIRKLGLTKRDRLDLLAFLRAISSPPPGFKKPQLPE